MLEYLFLNHKAFERLRIFIIENKKLIADLEAVQLSTEADKKEVNILNLSLKQKDAEIDRLKELTRLVGSSNDPSAPRRKKIQNAALFLRLDVPSMLIRHETELFENRRNLKTPDLWTENIFKSELFENYVTIILIFPCRQIQIQNGRLFRALFQISPAKCGRGANTSLITCAVFCRVTRYVRVTFCSEQGPSTVSYSLVVGHTAVSAKRCVEARRNIE